MIRSCVFLLLLAFAGVVYADGPVIVERAPVVVERYTGPIMSTSPSVPSVRSHATTSTAQGVAEMMARSGQCRHFGNPAGGYEGVGMGGSPDSALGNCCYSRSGMRVFDQGVARGANGRWYACKRYR
jgi:hypothetical protein